MGLINPSETLPELGIKETSSAVRKDRKYKGDTDQSLISQMWHYVFNLHLCRHHGFGDTESFGSATV